MIVVLGNTKYTRRLQRIPFVDVYIQDGWSWEENKRWIEEHWEKGSLFVVIPGSGLILSEELNLISRLSYD